MRGLYIVTLDLLLSGRSMKRRGAMRSGSSREVKRAG